LCEVFAQGPANLGGKRPVMAPCEFPQDFHEIGLGPERYELV
jgi:hypothetical protein